MKVRKEVMMLLKMYGEGKYSTETFCELFVEVYFFSKSAYRCFHGNERVVLDELASVAERFSDNVDNVGSVEGIQAAEIMVKEKFDKVLDIFKL